MGYWKRQSGSGGHRSSAWGDGGESDRKPPGGVRHQSQTDGPLSRPAHGRWGQGRCSGRLRDGGLVENRSAVFSSGGTGRADDPPSKGVVAHGAGSASRCESARQSTVGAIAALLSPDAEIESGGRRGVVMGCAGSGSLAGGCRPAETGEGESHSAGASDPPPDRRTSAGATAPTGSATGARGRRGCQRTRADVAAALALAETAARVNGSAHPGHAGPIMRRAAGGVGT